MFTRAMLNVVTTLPGHYCQENGCQTVLVLDGSKKNNHPVCAAKEAGFVECAGVPGEVKTSWLHQSSKACSAQQKAKPNEGPIYSQPAGMVWSS